MGRPLKPIDAELVFKLGRVGLTQAAIADVFNVSTSVISERFRNEITRARACWKMSLCRAQWKRAKAGSDAMLIHLGKSELGQTYKVDVTSKGTTSVVYFERAHNPRDANCVIELPFKKTKESAGTVSHVEDNGAGDGFDVVGRTEGRGDRWNGATK